MEVAEETTFPFLEVVILFNVIVYTFHFYLDIRQRKALSLSKPPKQVAHLYDEDRFTKQQAYNIDKWNFGFVQGLFEAVLNNAMLYYGFLPKTWSYAGVLLARARLSGEIWQTIIWVLLSSVVSLVVGLPWSAYRTFVLEARHGFNRTTGRTFVMDLVKTVLLGLVLMPPIVAAVTYILQHSSPYIGLYLWAFVLGLSLLMMTIYPVLIAPLFNKFTPLETGSLRDGIEALAGSLKFPLTKLYVVDGSTRSAHSNAYMYGFFKNKRIVLYDTLLNQCNQDQVVAVLAHELGHWKLRHAPVLFGVSQLVLLAQLSLFTLLRTNRALYRSFGFRGSQPVFAALLMFQELIGPADEVLGFLSNMVSRGFEFQADRFGVRLGKGPHLREALCMLDKENKGAANVDPLYSAYYYTHPPLVERLKAIDAALKKGEGQDEGSQQQQQQQQQASAADGLDKKEL